MYPKPIDLNESKPFQQDHMLILLDEFFIPFIFCVWHPTESTRVHGTAKDRQGFTTIVANTSLHVPGPTHVDVPNLFMDLVAQRQLAAFARTTCLKLEGTLHYPKGPLIDLLCRILQGRGVDGRFARQRVKGVLQSVSWWNAAFGIVSLGVAAFHKPAHEDSRLVHKLMGCFYMPPCSYP